MITIHFLRLEMNVVRLEPPAVSGNTVSFRWAVEPQSSLYRKHEFFLRFPESVDVSRVSESLWWRITLISLHSHWALLRPCRVEVPVQLAPGEAEFWARLLDAEVATLEAGRQSDQIDGAVELVERGPALAPLSLFPDSGRSACAFSGGKDSLLQAGILCEILGNPILVATTSPMPPLREHDTPRRSHVFREVERRRKVEVVEVHSDFRSLWDNGFPRRLGYPVWTTEICDAFLYLSVLLAVGAARGARHLFVASEYEIQQTALRKGKIVQHRHCMYSVATLRALQGLLRPSGVSITSTTSSLRSFQVFDLLRSRYRDLWDLQYSCADVNDEGVPCSQCAKCLYAALSALSAGDSPEQLGIDVATLLISARLWTPRPNPGENGDPDEVVRAELHGQVRRWFQEIPVSQFVRVVKRKRFRALVSYARIRRRTFRRLGEKEPGYSAAFLDAADEILRQALESIVSSRFEPERTPSSLAAYDRSRSLASWITSPLG